jgi:hypothetical protein
MIMAYTAFFLVKAPNLSGFGQAGAVLTYLILAGVTLASWLAGFKVYDVSKAVLAAQSAEAANKLLEKRPRHALRATAMLLSAVVVLLVTDSAIGLGYRTSTQAHIYVTASRVKPAHQTLVVFPGYLMPGDILSRAFAPFLEPGEAMMVVGYAERGIDIDDIYTQVMRQVRDIGAPSLRVYGGSLGGMCAVQFLERYRRNAAQYGEPVLVLDTTPSSASRVKRPRSMFWLASWYRGGPITSGLWALGGQFQSTPDPEPTANPRLIDAGRHAEAWVGTPALSSQAQYLAAFPMPRANSLVNVAARVTYLRGHGPGTDPLVHLDLAIDDWRLAFPTLTVTTLPGRDVRWHLPLIERPQETMDAINNA